MTDDERLRSDAALKQTLNTLLLYADEHSDRIAQVTDEFDKHVMEYLGLDDPTNNRRYSAGELMWVVSQFVVNIAGIDLLNLNGKTDASLHSIVRFNLRLINALAEAYLDRAEAVDTAKAELTADAALRKVFGDNNAE